MIATSSSVIDTVVNSNINELSLDRMNLWISLLEMFSSVFGVFFTVALGLIAFLTWKHNDLRKKAEEDARRIQQIRIDLELQMGQYNLLLKQTKLLFQKIGVLARGAVKDSQSIEKLTKEIKNKKLSVDTIIQSIRKKTASINRSFDNLTVLSQYTPGDVITETKQDTFRNIIEEYQPKPKRGYNLETVKAALDMLKAREKTKNNGNIE